MGLSETVNGRGGAACARGSGMFFVGQVQVIHQSLVFRKGGTQVDQIS